MKEPKRYEEAVAEVTERTSNQPDDQPGLNSWQIEGAALHRCALAALADADAALDPEVRRLLVAEAQVWATLSAADVTDQALGRVEAAVGSI
jgi:hypothetical protein